MKRPAVSMLLRLWQFPQLLSGAVLLLLFRITGNARVFGAVHSARLIRVTLPGLRGGLTLGSYLFFFSRPSQRLIAHEFGHFLQSRLLGPFFLPLVGIPSFLRALLIRAKVISPAKYDSFLPEADATRRGNRFLGRG